MKICLKPWVIGVSIAAFIVCLWMVAHHYTDAGFRREQAAKWTDIQGTNHAGHVVRQGQLIYSDSTLTTVVGQRWECRDCNRGFAIQVPTWTVAK